MSGLLDVAVDVWRFSGSNKAWSCEVCTQCRIRASLRFESHNINETSDEKTSVETWSVEALYSEFSEENIMKEPFKKTNPA